MENRQHRAELAELKGEIAKAPAGAHRNAAKNRRRLVRIRERLERLDYLETRAKAAGDSAALERIANERKRRQAELAYRAGEAEADVDRVAAAGEAEAE